jgi:hypothetical protein
MVHSARGGDVEFDFPKGLFILQGFSVLGLIIGLLGLHNIEPTDPFQPADRLAGSLCLVLAALWLIGIGNAELRVNGWSAAGLVVGLPILASIPAYWLFWSRVRSRVFVWIAAVLWLGLAILVFAIDTASSGEGVTGYWGLVAAALASGLIVYGYRKLYLRKLTLSPAEMERARQDPWGTIGAAIGVSVGGAILRVVIPKLASDLQAAVNGFIIGLLAFSLLGCAAWQFLWEIGKQQR